MNVRSYQVFPKCKDTKGFPYFKIDRQLSFADVPDHPAEDHGVEGQHGVPVEPSPDTHRAECGGLGQDVVVVDAELKPGFAGKFHLRIEQEPLFRFIGQDHPPEIERIPGHDLPGAGSSAPDTHATNKAVEKTPDIP